MLTGSMPGYMPPVEAWPSAFDDLRAHELAVIAGMRAALGAVLEALRPGPIEARLAGADGDGQDADVEPQGQDVGPAGGTVWRDRREADDDLQRLYGEKFSQAYEEQVARLRRARQ
jgi:type VI secretion system protein